MSTLLNDLSHNAVNYVLTQQGSMNEIIEKETDRLSAKSDSIDQAVLGQQRLISLNQNYSNRYNQYIIIIIVIVVALVLFLGITLIQRSMTEPPTGIFTFLTILIFGGAFVYIIIIYNTILGRSNMDYDQLNISTPQPLSVNEIAAQQKANTASGNLLGGISAGDSCIGAACCANGTVWDISSQMCIIKDGFSTLQMYPINSQSNSMSGSIQPYTISEYDGYSHL